jgi:hypothetical protein
VIGDEKDWVFLSWIPLSKSESLTLACSFSQI